MAARPWNELEADRLHAFGYGPTAAAVDMRRCRGCGCTDDYACPGGCWWVADDLCNRCWASYGGTD